MEPQDFSNHTPMMAWRIQGGKTTAAAGNYAETYAARSIVNPTAEALADKM